MKEYPSTKSKTKVRSRTGRPDWFSEMKREAAFKRMLSKIRTEKLKPSLGPIADLLVNAGYETVWDVSQETDNRSFTENGMFRFQLLKLHDYLTRNGIPMKWNPPAE